MSPRAYVGLVDHHGAGPNEQRLRIHQPHLTDALRLLCTPDITLPDGLLSVTWSRGDRRILAIVARHGQPFTGSIRWQGQDHRLVGVQHAVLG